MSRYRSGFKVMEMIAAAIRVFDGPSSRRPRLFPAVARMNENSPIWARATATETATRSGYLSSRTMARAASGLPSRTMASVAATSPGDSSR